MKVFLTGGTGLIGSATLKALLAKGHSVTAFVRSDKSAKAVESAGATPLFADILATEDLTKAIAECDAAIHLASPSDETSADVDRSMATAATTAFANTDNPYVHTGGIWVYGNSADITEDLPFNAPAITAWRADVEAVALGGKGMRTSVIEPAIVYGNGAGLPTFLVQSPTTDTGAFKMIGDGSQHWATVHVDDLADLYVSVLESGKQGYYLGANGQNPTVRELTEAASRAAGSGDVSPSSKQETDDRIGAMLAEALLLDQQASGAKARRELNWNPTRPSLVEELETGSYSPKAN